MLVKEGGHIHRGVDKFVKVGGLRCEHKARKTKSWFSIIAIDESQNWIRFTEHENSRSKAA